MPAERQTSGIQKKITEDFTSLEDEILGLKTPKAGTVVQNNKNGGTTNGKEDATRRYSSFSIMPIPS